MLVFSADWDRGISQIEVNGERWTPGLYRLLLFEDDTATATGKIVITH